MGMRASPIYPPLLWMRWSRRPRSVSWEDLTLQARSWFKSTPFVLELTKYEYFDVKNLAGYLPTGVEITLHKRPLDERVGAALFDPRWQSLWA
jgi:hypothetical protein